MCVSAIHCLKKTYVTSSQVNRVAWWAADLCSQRCRNQNSVLLMLFLCPHVFSHTVHSFWNALPLPHPSEIPHSFLKCVVRSFFSVICPTESCHYHHTYKFVPGTFVASFWNFNDIICVGSISIAPKPDRILGKIRGKQYLEWVKG